MSEGLTQADVDQLARRLQTTSEARWPLDEGEKVLWLEFLDDCDECSEGIHHVETTYLAIPHDWTVEDVIRNIRKKVAGFNESEQYRGYDLTWQDIHFDLELGPEMRILTLPKPDLVIDVHRREDILPMDEQEEE